MRDDERYSRQKDIVPPERIAACKATVIGVGAIGRQVALQLTAMGIPRLQLVDHDRVETSNLASQGYLESDLGRPKVEATADLCRQINSDIDIRIAGRFDASSSIIYFDVHRLESHQRWIRSNQHSKRIVHDGHPGRSIWRPSVGCFLP